MKKNSLIIMLLVCLGVSCTQNDTPVYDAPRLTNAVLNSDQFKSLGLDVSQLSVNDAILDATPSGKRLLIIPSKIDGKNHAVLTILDDSYRPAISAYIEVNMSPETHQQNAFREPTDPNPATSDPNPSPSHDPVSVAYHAGTFNGTITVTASTSYRTNYSFYHSSLSGGSVTPIGSAANTDRCRGWTETGGPLDCAGKALISSGPISSAACYWTFGYCFGALIIDCWLTGC